MSSLSIHPLDEFAQIVRPPARIAALDISTRKIGIALCTPDWQMVTPVKTIERTKWVNDLAALDKALTPFEVTALIVGLPLNMDGSPGPRVQSVKQFVFNLIKAEPKWLNGPIAFVDESMTTAKAAEFIDHHKNLGRARSSGALDAIAAQVILERALALLQQQP